MKNTVYIGIGSNTGRRLDYILSSIEKIDGDTNCHVINVSSFYETKPFGFIEQNNFINAVIKIETSYSPADLFRLLKLIEKDLGRNENVKWGPREIDLDILFYNDLIYQDNNITIPHKGIVERDFVLVPLCEIEPEMIYPGSGCSVSEIKIPQKDSNIINKIPTDLHYKWIKQKLILT